jgi:hypothetical protein
MYNGSDKGAWKILVHQQQFKNFRKWLDIKWKSITATITTEATDNKPPTHPPYSITSAADYESDAEDDDEDSYATAFSNAMSAASVRDKDWNLELPPELPRGPGAGSYVEAVTQRSSASQMSKLTQGTASAGRGGSGRGGRGHGFAAGHSSYSDTQQQTQQLIAALETANADRESDRKLFEIKLTEMQRANEELLQTKADDSLTLQAQVLQLTASMAQQSTATTELSAMVKQMLTLQSGIRDGPPTPKRRAISQNKDSPDQPEAGPAASDDDPVDHMDEK